MKYIIAGGRDFGNRTLEDGSFDMAWYTQCWNQLAHACSRVIQMNKLAPTVITGGAKGADSIGDAWAMEVGLITEVFEANWAAYGKSAGPVRNEQMALAADGLVAFWDGKSRGTKDMIRRALTKGLEVHVYRY